MWLPKLFDFHAFTVKQLVALNRYKEMVLTSVYCSEGMFIMNAKAI